MSSDKRLQQLHDWLAGSLSIDDYQLQPASGDASFRRYFRLSHNGHSYIMMDAPPAQEDCRPFVDIARVLLDFGLNVPEVIEQDLEQGFLLLSDLGQVQFLDVLNNNTVDCLYGDAMAALLRLQAGDAQYEFPRYDAALLRTEMMLFRDWLLERHLQVHLADSEIQKLDAVFALLIDSALQQPQVIVHRDYHSRNLMQVEKHNPGILDFQDAVIGPLTYDLVSLLRDCYIEWPEAKVKGWVLTYQEQATQAGIIADVTPVDFLRWFDWMGVQRHLKAAGIFARLNHRDNKPGYLQDIPRTVTYITRVCERYPELHDLHTILQSYVSPSRLAEVESSISSSG